MGFDLGIRAVLFDRDGTLVVDVPYNGDPARVHAAPTAASAVARAREAGLAIGVVSNQSAVARGILTADQVEAVNARVDELLGPFDVWEYCPHAPADGCACRKPEPGLILRACTALGIEPEQAVVIGDIAADMTAADRAGAYGILVPTTMTLRAEVEAAGMVADDLEQAVDRVLAGPLRRARSMMAGTS
jgi:D-glycero-D-manno-heptose 1,7-bisphosphate phosphatase